MIQMPEHHQRKRSITFSISSYSSPRTSPPPDFLLDDDPFANLTGPPIDRVSVPFLPPIPPLPSSSRSTLALAQVPLPLTPVEGSGAVISPVSPTPIPRSPLHELPLPNLASLDAAALASVSGSGLSLASASASSSFTTTSTQTQVSSFISASTSGSGLASTSASASPILSVPRPPHPHLAPLAPPKPVVPGLAAAPSSPPAGRGSPILSPRTRPACQRPAFSSRPSLPSLDTLARMNVVLTKKVQYFLLFSLFIMF
ncbi:hypothetical protein CPB84DRAFT_1543980 [Gymnopilus junonius]|uniref:Uncharacterized protein n=1 Tax=Gymnopilus junonius TaxID=109634 RepID=A0A9P5TIZ5_GYMJU|nr:hypothetical protein CPB84DRAFT_1543980 [Gymnopilus junonius]